MCPELGSHSSLTPVAELTVTAYAGTCMKTPAIERAPGILWALSTTQHNVAIDVKSTELHLKILHGSSGPPFKTKPSCERRFHKKKLSGRATLSNLEMTGGRWKSLLCETQKSGYYLKDGRDFFFSHCRQVRCG